MSTRHEGCWIGFILVGLLAGCASPGPRFDARQPELLTGATASLSGGQTNTGSLLESAFSAIQPTNQIRPEWLIAPTNFFRLGPGDSLDIEVLGEQTSRTSVLVGPDGRIYFSLLPGLQVWGLTLTETRDLLERELARYIRIKPEVTVTLKAVGSKRVWVLGSIQNPGVYSLATPLTLLEAVSSAGGIAGIPGTLSGAPDLQNSFLLRKGEIVPVDFNRLLSQGDLSQNVFLQPDDFVYLRPATARNVYVLGAVAVPNIVPHADTLTLAGAVASAGGTLEYAYLSHVAVVRGSLASPRIAIVDYKAICQGKETDVRLQPGDIVYVPYVPYRKLALFAEAILRQFVFTIASNEGYKAADLSLGPPAAGMAPLPPEK